MISLLCPTRGRPNQAERLIKSFFNTQKNQNQILFYVANDDECKEQYYELFNKYKIGFYKGPPMSTSFIWNFLAHEATGEMVTLIGDDVEIKTKNWDEIFIQANNIYKDKIYVLTVDDGRQDRFAQNDGRMRCDHPTVNKKWMQTLKYFVPPFFMHRYLDAYTRSLAIKIDRFIEIKEVVFEHLKFETISDKTGKLSRSWFDHDKHIYETLAKRYYDVDLELLKKTIKN